MKHISLFESFSFKETIDTMYDIILHHEDKYTIKFTISDIFNRYYDYNRIKSEINNPSYNITLVPDRPINLETAIKDTENIIGNCLNMCELKFKIGSILLSTTSLRFNQIPIKTKDSLSSKIYSITLILRPNS